MNTCKRQWLGIGELSGFHSLLMFLQSCQHVSQVQLNWGFTLLPSCFGECLLSSEERKKEQVHTNERLKHGIAIKFNFCAWIQRIQPEKILKVSTCNFFCSMLISEYSCAVAKAAARAFFRWLLALLGTEVVIGIGVCTMFIGEFSGRLSSCETCGDKNKPSVRSERMQRMIYSIFVLYETFTVSIKITWMWVTQAHYF